MFGGIERSVSFEGGFRFVRVNVTWRSRSSQCSRLRTGSSARSKTFEVCIVTSGQGIENLRNSSSGLLAYTRGMYHVVDILWDRLGSSGPNCVFFPC